MKKKLRSILLYLSIVYLGFKVINFASRHFGLDQDFALGLFVVGALVYIVISTFKKVFGGGNRDIEN